MQKAFGSEIKGFGRRVKKLRQEKKLTQQALADACEVDIRTIQRVERGDFGCGLHLVFALAKALAVPSANLFRKGASKD